MTKMTVFEGLHSPVTIEDPKGKLTTSEKLWTVFADDRESFLLGVWRETPMGVPYLWFIPKNFRKADLRYMRETFKEIFDHYAWLEAQVLTLDPSAQRFAEWFGFEKVREEGELIRYEVHRD